MTEFDATKAMREQIGGLIRIRTFLQTRERILQTKFAEVEGEMASAAQLRGLTDILLEDMRERLRKAEEG